MTTPPTDQTMTKKKSKREEKEVASLGDATKAAPPPPSNDDERPKTKKSKKKKHKSKKRRRQEGGEDNDDDNANDADGQADAAPVAPIALASPSAAQPTKEERRAARAAGKATRAAARRAPVPTHDPETHIAYSKVQLRRMKRRVKHGLAPIASAEEERELRAREKRERFEEERLYAASVGDEEDAEDNAEADAKDDAEDDSPDDAEDVSTRDNEGKNAGPANISVNNEDLDREENQENLTKKERKRHNPPSKNTKRAKPVPPGYVCMACNNENDSPPHWIYDCPKKVTTKGCNATAKRLRGLHDPPSRKVFVGGLPFDCDEGSVRHFFEGGLRSRDVAAAGDDDVDDNAELVHVKLLTFDDSKRCKGQAFLTFASDEAALRALRLNNAIWEEAKAEEKKKKKQKTATGQGGAEGDGKRKELRVKVTKVLNRFVTKKQRGGHVQR